MQPGSTTRLKIVSISAIAILLLRCDHSTAPEYTDETFLGSTTRHGDPLRISHIKTYFSLSHQGIAVDDRYIYGIYSYFISVTEKESGKSTSFDFLYSGNTIKDYTKEMNDYVREDAELMSFNAAAGDAFYFGGYERFRSVMFAISHGGSGTWDIAWEYWNGNSWTGLSGINDGTNGFRNWGSKLLLYDFPQDWERTAINDKQAYYIRARVSSISSMISNPIADWVFVGRYTRDDMFPASNHFSDGTVETEDGIRYLYVIGPGDSNVEGKVARYSIPELGLEGIEHSWDVGRGDFSGVDKHEIDGQEYWWVIWDISGQGISQNTITRYNLDWTEPVDYALKYYQTGTYNYQGFTWWSNGVDNFVFANIHSPDGTTDVYKWNGRDFTPLKRLNQVTSYGFEANQGLTWEEDTGYLWAAARGHSIYSAFKCRVIFINGDPTDPSVDVVY